ncbi:hypothetical protein D9M68_871200 [compost metagenome]
MMSLKARSTRRTASAVSAGATRSTTSSRLALRSGSALWAISSGGSGKSKSESVNIVETARGARDGSESEAQSGTRRPWWQPAWVQSANPIL